MISPAPDTHPDEVAAVLQGTLGPLVRRMRHNRQEGEPTIPEGAALGLLYREGPMTAADLARREQITPQSIAHTLAGLEGRGLVKRVADPTDGRRIILSLTEAGEQTVLARRARRSAQMARALSKHFTEDELATLLQAGRLLDRLTQVSWR